jgi:hypothetical protein
MESSHFAVLAAVLLVAAVGAFVIFSAPAQTGMVAGNVPYECTAAGGQWYAPYGCMMTQHLCRAASGNWRIRDNQCVNYDHVKVCSLSGGTWNRLSQTCITGVIQ